MYIIENNLLHLNLGCHPNRDFDTPIAGAPIQDLEFGTFLEKALQRQNSGLWDKIGTFSGPFLHLFGTFSRYFHKNAEKLTKSKKGFKNCVVATFSAKLRLFRDHF